MNKIIIPVFASILILCTIGLTQDAFAFIPVSSCSVLNVPGETYYLTNSISSSLTCIEINSPDITLDGNGFTISGPGLVPLPTPTSPAKYGIDVNSDHTTIKNVRVSDYHVGITLQFTENNVLTNNTATNTLVGIEGSNSGGNIYERNTVNNNSWYGIRISGAFSDNSIIRENTANNNGRTGIYLVDPDNNEISGNIVTSNGNWGISFTRSNNNQVFDNVISSNPIGLQIAETESGVVYNNVFSNTQQTHLVSNLGIIDFDLSAPVGGNSWSNYDEPSEGCFDNNADGFCDSPFVFTGGQDNLPFCKICEPDLPKNPLDLIVLIEDLELDNSIENSLLAPLQQAQDMLDDNNPNNDGAACGKINAFINHVNAQKGKTLTLEQAESLLEAAESVKENLGC